MFSKGGKQYIRSQGKEVVRDGKRPKPPLTPKPNNWQWGDQCRKEVISVGKRWNWVRFRRCTVEKRIYSNVTAKPHLREYRWEGKKHSPHAKTPPVRQLFVPCKGVCVAWYIMPPDRSNTLLGLWVSPYQINSGQ